MPFITQGKANWKFLLIAIVLAVIVGGGILGWIKTQKIPPSELPEIEKPKEIKEGESYIKVISPNGGEEWMIGKTYEIKWESRGLEKVTIDLYGPIPGQRPFSKQIATGVSASFGAYSWTLSEDIPSGNGFVIVAHREGEVYPRDESDDYFSVVKNETVNWGTARIEGETHYATYKYEMKYPQDWDYTKLETPPYPTMFAPKEIIMIVKESPENIGSDKALTLWVTAYDRIVYEGGILPYRMEPSGKPLRVTSSEITANGIKGTRYVSEYLKDTPEYKIGDKTVTIDLAINEIYFSFHLFDYQYVEMLNKMLSTFKVLE